MDPSSVGDRALRLAARAGHLAVVERLLADPRVNRQPEETVAVIEAAAGGHAAVVERLLSDRLHPANDPSVTAEALCAAVAMGDAAVVDALMRQRRAAGAIPDADVFLTAAAFGDDGMLHETMLDGRLPLGAPFQEPPSLHVRCSRPAPEATSPSSIACWRMKLNDRVACWVNIRSQKRFPLLSLPSARTSSRSCSATRASLAFAARSTRLRCGQERGDHMKSLQAANAACLPVAL